MTNNSTWKTIIGPPHLSLTRVKFIDYVGVMCQAFNFNNKKNSALYLHP